MKARTITLAVGIVMFNALVTCFGAEESQERKAAANRELKHLQGEWLLTALENRRISSTSYLIPSTFDGRLLIKGDTVDVSLLIQGEKHDYSQRLQLDPTKNPKHHDEIIPNEATVKGIYELTGDTLKQCICPNIGGPRPRSLENGQYLV